MVNAFRYIGKDETRPVNKHASDHIVMQLMRPYLNKGRNVITNNCFTSVMLATQLKEKQTNLLETLFEKDERTVLFFQTLKIWKYHPNCVLRKSNQTCVDT